MTDNKQRHAFCRNGRLFFQMQQKNLNMERRPCLLCNPLTTTECYCSPCSKLLDSIIIRKEIHVCELCRQSFSSKMTLFKHKNSLSVVCSNGYLPMDVLVRRPSCVCGSNFQLAATLQYHHQSKEATLSLKQNVKYA